MLPARFGPLSHEESDLFAVRKKCGGQYCLERDLRADPAAVAIYELLHRARRRVVRFFPVTQ